MVPCAAETIAGLQDEIKTATTALIEAQTSTVSVSSGCELFVRSISLTSKMGEEEVKYRHLHSLTLTVVLGIGRTSGS